MGIDFILQLLAYTIPALVLAAVAYVFFTKLLDRQTKKDLILVEKLRTQNTVDLQALKLQALERLIILVERIELKKLILRINPISNDKTLYQINLINHIEQEFDYNIAQQIYVSEKLWQALVQTKNDIIVLIQNTSSNLNIADADQLRLSLISNTILIEQKLDLVRQAIKQEVNIITE